MIDLTSQVEVQIYQEQLDRFLVVAQRLKLEGLTSQDDEQKNKINDAGEDTKINLKNNFERGKQRETTQIKNIKSETPKSERRRQSVSSSVVVAGSFSDLNTEEIDQKIEQCLVKAEDGTYSCGVCGKAGNLNLKPGNQKQNMRKHIETHLDGLSFPCQSCGKKFSSRNSLTSHKAKYHRS